MICIHQAFPDTAMPSLSRRPLDRSQTALAVEDHGSEPSAHAVRAVDQPPIRMPRASRPLDRHTRGSAEAVLPFDHHASPPGHATPALDRHRFDQATPCAPSVTARAVGSRPAPARSPPEPMTPRPARGRTSPAPAEEGRARPPAALGAKRSRRPSRARGRGRRSKGFRKLAVTRARPGVTMRSQTDILRARTSFKKNDTSHSTIAGSPLQSLSRGFEGSDLLVRSPRPPPPRALEGWP